MDHTYVLIDPTAELEAAQRPRLPRPTALEGLKVGLLDISKARGDIFLNRLAARLKELGVTVRHYRKPTFARVAPVSLRQQMAAECDTVIEALAD